MLQIVVERHDGSRECYQSNTIPFSEDELERQVLLYYRGANCDRCRNAVLQSGLSQLCMDTQAGKLSEASLALFPMLSDCKNVSIKEN